jgi:hypothetical protein
VSPVSYTRVIAIGSISSALCAFTWVAMYPLLLIVPALSFGASACFLFFDLKDEVDSRQRIVFLWLISSLLSWWVAIAWGDLMGINLCGDWIDPPTFECLEYKKRYLAARWNYSLLAGATSGLIMSIGHSLAILKWNLFFYLASAFLGALLLLPFYLSREWLDWGIYGSRPRFFFWYVLIIGVWQVGMLLWFVWYDKRYLRTKV